MKIFAVIENNLVTNKIIAESKELAETLTGFSCVELQSSLDCNIGYSYANNKFIEPSPYPSWIYNEELEEWVAPVAMPTDEVLYAWSEANLAWEAVTE
jgi:hypothetical protein